MSECIACGFNSDIKPVGEWNIILNMSAYSGNEIGGNEKGRNGWKYRKAKKAYRTAVQHELAHIDEAKGRRRVWLTRVYRKGKRPYDPDNLLWGFKPLVDIMVAEGIFLDDDPKSLERIYKQIPGHSDNDSIHICIQELPDE
jgi:hypothetical protein